MRICETHLNNSKIFGEVWVNNKLCLGARSERSSLLSPLCSRNCWSLLWDSPTLNHYSHLINSALEKDIHSTNDGPTFPWITEDTVSKQTI